MITEQEFLEVCNRVREAGEGERLTAVLPGVPGNASQCLIARNLNFECRVRPGQGVWKMYVNDAKLAERIAKALDTEWKPWGSIAYTITLPDSLGYLAKMFDYGVRRQYTWLDEKVVSLPE